MTDNRAAYETFREDENMTVNEKAELIVEDIKK